MSLSKVSASKSARRSRSVDASYSRRERFRTPAVDLVPNLDAATQVSVALSKSVLQDPSVNLGTLIGTAADSRRDINISDTTILVSTAILEHLGGKESARRMLKKSVTCSKIYERMGLEREELRSMLVTMIFALNPEFVKMLEISLEIAIKEATKLTQVPFTSGRIETAAEALSVMSDRGDIAVGRKPYKRRDSIQTTPTELIRPSDSISNVGAAPKGSLRKSINESDLMRFIRRRSRGEEPEFGEVFFTAKEPVQATKYPPRSGLGSKREMVRRPKEEAAQAIDRIIGSATVASYNLSSGKGNIRRPRIEDYADMSEVSSAVFNKVPDTVEDGAIPRSMIPKTGAEPTDTFLETSTQQTYDSSATAIKRKDSFEQMMDQINRLNG